MKQLISRIINSKLYFILITIVFIIGMILLFSTEKAYFLKQLDKIRSTSLNDFFIFVTKIGEYYSFVFIFFYFLYKKSRISFSILVIGIVMPLTSYILKQFFSHPRPITYFYKYLKDFPINGIKDLHYHSGHNSFPSGHTMAAFTLFTLLALISSNRYYHILYFLIAILVGLSRIYLVQHFLEDVLFGASIGVVIALIVYYFTFILLKDKSYLDIEFKSK